MSIILYCKVKTIDYVQEPPYAELKGLNYKLAENASEATDKAMALVADFILGRDNGWRDCGSEMREQLKSVMGIGSTRSDVKIERGGNKYLLQWFDTEEHFECYDEHNEVSLYIKIR